jgi:hypothetical protein
MPTSHDQQRILAVAERDETLHRMRLLIRVISVSLWAGLSFLAGAEPFVPGSSVNAAPRPVAADGIEAEIRIADAPWLDRELTRFAAALGRDSKPLRRQLAQTLYHTKSLDAIDTTRPALFIWRRGASPLQAIIPITPNGRRQFIEEFGFMGAGQPPLVRVGDRDGTVIYSQNHPDGLREFRLLITDSVAYLARNVDECRMLAARAATLLPVVGSAAPVALICTGDWLRRSRLTDWSWSPRLPVHSWLPTSALLAAAQAAALDQIELLTCEIKAVGDGRARISARITAQPQSEFAAWIASQQNLGNRILSQFTQPDTAIRIGLHLAWQDKLELFGASQSAALQKLAGATWTPEVQDAWHEALVWTQRCTDAVWTLAVPQAGRQLHTLAIEVGGAEDQVARLNQVAGALTGTTATTATVTGFMAAKRQLKPLAGRPPGTQVLMATTRDVLLFDGWNVPEADVLRHAGELARRLQQIPLAPSEPALIDAYINLGRLMRLAPEIDTELMIPDAIAYGTLRTAGVNILQGELTIPLVDSAAALNHLPDEGVRSR